MVVLAKSGVESDCSFLFSFFRLERVVHLLHLDNKFVFLTCDSVSSGRNPAPSFVIYTKTLLKKREILGGLKRLSLGDLLDADTKFCRNILTPGIIDEPISAILTF